MESLLPAQIIEDFEDALEDVNAQAIRIRKAMVVIIEPAKPFPPAAPKHGIGASDGFSLRYDKAMLVEALKMTERLLHLRDVVNARMDAAERRQGMQLAEERVCDV